MGIPFSHSSLTLEAIGSERSFHFFGRPPLDCLDIALVRNTLLFECFDFAYSACVVDFRWVVMEKDRVSNRNRNKMQYKVKGGTYLHSSE